MDALILQAFNGLSLGSILLLVSLGLAFAFGLMGVINMAHGEFIMIGAYVAYLFQQTFAGVLGGVELGIWFVLALPAAFLVAAALGALMEVSLVRYLYGRPLDTLLATWGVGLILQQAARSIFGAPNVNVSSPTWLSGGVDIGAGLLLPYKRIFIIVLVVVVVAAVYYYLYRTINGRRLRAVMQNREMASCLGVRSRWVDAGTFALGTGLAGVAGVALTQLGSIGPALGTFYIVDAFMVVVLGGVGRLPGTILAALLIGVMNTVLELGTSATVGKVLVLLLIIAFLQWKPSGLAALQTR
ncbi:MAG: urea ABC transporter permease subunit UrtB [Caldilineaceae bacterium]|nr:urea ABC transporter permease subunit UrtB [Caldilineaceae bacterium]MCB0185583.1 urea ABC transporter permease subunit UrtB [Caldilineaceae bacterium]